MDILTIFSSAVPGILGLSSLLVSWRQYATTKEQVRIELFDKRYKVYSAARRFASKALLENKVENTDFRAPRIIKISVYNCVEWTIVRFHIFA